MSTIVPSVKMMPERAWTTCVSGGAISGLARSNYVPFAPQPFPPGMTADEYAALDPAPVPGFGVPPPLDCFPRYVMWREDRIPDFAGGEPGIIWTRDPGWEFRNDCVVPTPPEPEIRGWCVDYYRGSESSFTGFGCQIDSDMIGSTLDFDFGDGSPHFTLGPIQEIDLGMQEWSHVYTTQGTFPAVLNIAGGNPNLEWHEELNVRITGSGLGDQGASMSCYWVQFYVWCNGGPGGVADIVGNWYISDYPGGPPTQTIPFTLVTDANGELLLNTIPQGAYSMDAVATPRTQCPGGGGSMPASQNLYPGLNYVIFDFMPV